MSFLTNLFPSLNLGNILDLKQILASLGLGDLKAKLLARITKSINDQAGQIGGEELGRDVCENIDSMMESHGGTFTPEQSIAVGTGLAEQAAVACEQTAAIIRHYATLQAAVVAAKTADPVDAAALAAAREVRNAGTDAVKAAFQGIGKASGGGGGLQL